MEGWGKYERERPCRGESEPTQPFKTDEEWRASAEEIFNAGEPRPDASQTGTRLRVARHLEVAGIGEEGGGLQRPRRSATSVCPSPTVDVNQSERK